MKCILYFQTIATPLTAKLLHWGELENSLMYCTAGAEVRLRVLLEQSHVLHGLR